MLKKRFWTTKNIIFTILVIVLLLMLPKIVGILMLFFGAYVIACALNPYVSKLMKKMKNRTVAASVVLFSSIAAIIALFIPIAFVAYKEIKTFLTTMPEKLSDFSTFFMNTKIYGHKLPEMIDFDTILGSSSNLAQGVVNQSLTFTVTVFQLIMITVALTMIVYYILVDKTYLKTKFLEFFPPDLKDKANEILTNISNKVGGYVRAQIISMAAVGIMVSIVLVIFGVEYATLLGLVSGLLDIVPILGPTINCFRIFSSTTAFKLRCKTCFIRKTYGATPTNDIFGSVLSGTILRFLGSNLVTCNSCYYLCFDR